MILRKMDKGGCVACPPEMGCLGSACPMIYEVQMRCDICNCVAEELYRVDGVDMCESCFDNTYTHITELNCCDYMTD